MRGSHFEQNYRPQFSGHQTFTLRYGWLKKAFDAVTLTERNNENKSIFLDDDSIARFGVGKNMVSSIRHWATATGIIEEPSNSQIIRTTELGQKIFNSKGYDPYMEHPTTLWLVHWQLAAVPTKTTWFWSFNYFTATTFEREHLLKELMKLVDRYSWPHAAEKTVKNDVACFVNTYAAHRSKANAAHDDVLESPLMELGLIKAIGRDNFRFVRGPKSTLGDGVFIYALLEFWQNYSPTTSTLSFEAIAHEPGGPGRVFLLNENDVADRLIALDEATRGVLRWSEVTGLRQVVRSAEIDKIDPLSYIDAEYKAAMGREAA